jgi:hypothetical protein
MRTPLNPAGSARLFSRFLLLLFISTILTPTALLADNIYVAPWGWNGRSRAESAHRDTPVKTLQRAVNMVRAGDTIIALDGNYFGLVYLSRSGTQGAPITIKSENRHGAKLIGSIQTDNQSHFIIDGMDVSNRRTDTDFGTKGIRIDGCHHVVIRNCRVHDCRGGGINCDHCDWLLLEWNIVHHNAFWDVNQHSGISIYQPRYLADDDANFGIIVRNNTCFSNENKLDNPDWGRPTDGNGIVMDDFRNISSGGNGVLYDRKSLVTNNFCYLNGGQGIHNYRANNVFVRNNTCYKNMKSFDFGGEVSVSESQKCYVYNNILFARGGKNVALQYDSWSVWWDYNVLFNGPSFQVNNGSSTIYQNPQFQPGSLRLRASSPAINVGLTHNGVFPFDVDGQPRVVGGRVDRGAKEFVPWFDN